MDAAQTFLPGRNLKLAGWSPQQLHRVQDPTANHLSLPPIVPLTNIIGDETLALKLKGKKGFCRSRLQQGEVSSLPQAYNISRINGQCR